MACFEEGEELGQHRVSRGAQTARGASALEVVVAPLRRVDLEEQVARELGQAEHDEPARARIEKKAGQLLLSCERASVCEVEREETHPR